MTDSSHNLNFSVGEPMLLVDERDREYLVVVPPPEGPPARLRGEAFASEILCQQQDGGVLVSPQRKRYLVLRPTLGQIVMNMPRQAQVIYPKDLALLLMWGDVAPGQRVVEIGCGHGALTMALLRALGPEGRLTTYDLRRDHLNRTRKNIAAYLGPEFLERWTPVVGDPSQEGVAEQGVDRLFSDVPEPWTMLEAAAACLHPGGIWAAYLPTVLQMAEQVKGLNGHPAFGLAQCFEALQRFWQVKPPSVRPKHSMSAHTGFLVMGRRRYKPALPPAQAAPLPQTEAGASAPPPETGPAPTGETA
ncbi:MAG: methyltransferase domain-containing protein [Desulfarculus sp.]|nr:methyltransferase domain-containing protein [Desulfarculus sp.]